MDLLRRIAILAFGRARAWALVLLASCLTPFASAADQPGAKRSFDERALARLAAPPLGLPAVPGLERGAPSAAQIALGRKLMFDRRLSHAGTMSCAMCHVPEQGFTNNEMKTSIGVFGLSLRRNSSTLFNVAYQRSLFHEGRETSLETQIISPLLARNEMANPSIGYLIDKIGALDDYDGLFERAFDRAPSIELLGRALAAYQRTLLSANSPFDRWYFGGEQDAVGAAAKRGFELFKKKAGCIRCHKIAEDHALFTDHKFHFTGIGYRSHVERARQKGPVSVEISPGVKVPLAREAVLSVSGPREPDLGRHEVTLDPEHLWQYKTPGLRNVALTAPYMHDGSLTTLRDVVVYYNYPNVQHPQLDARIVPLGLTFDEVDELIAFLESLTGDNVDELVADARSVAVGN